MVLYERFDKEWADRLGLSSIKNRGGSFKRRIDFIVRFAGLFSFDEPAFFQFIDGAAHLSFVIFKIVQVNIEGTFMFKVQLIAYKICAYICKWAVLVVMEHGFQDVLCMGVQCIVSAPQKTV